MDIGRIQQREIVEEMRDSYLDYAMSVIVARALPDVRDGLKPAHRRILFEDLMNYKREIDKERQKALDELVKQSQQLNMGY